jgi:hypothetical protein
MHDFKPGDIVQLSPKAAQKSKFPNRRGTVIAIGRPSSQISVLWYKRETPQRLHFSMLRHAWREAPQDEEL